MTKTAENTPSYKTSTKDAEGKGTTYDFLPHKLVLVDQKDHLLYDPRISMELDKTHLDSVQSVGVLLPILAVWAPHHETGEKCLMVVDGRQRTRLAGMVNAYREAGQFDGDPITVPVRVMGDVSRIKDEEKLREAFKSFEDMVAITNEIRTDDDDVTRAAKVCGYMDRGRTAEEAASAFGVSKSHLKNYKNLMKCSPRVLKLVREQKLTLTDAVKAKLHKAEDKAAEDAAIEGIGGLRRVNPVTGKAVRERGRKTSTSKKSTKKSKGDSSSAPSTSSSEGGAGDEEDRDPYAEQVVYSIGGLLAVSGDPETDDEDWSTPEGIEPQTAQALQFFCGVLPLSEVTDKALKSALQAAKKAKKLN